MKSYLEKIGRIIGQLLGQTKSEPPPVHYPAYAHTQQEVIEQFSSSLEGLSQEEAAKRLEELGKNVLPCKKAPGPILIFFRQFLSPFIYILLIAAIISCLLQHWNDAIFIALVLLINAIVGSTQEYSAEKSAKALQEMVKTQTFVLRKGGILQINSSDLVVGDIVHLESGMKVPADIRLLYSSHLKADESLLTGESEAVEKDSQAQIELGMGTAERKNMLFAGTLVIRGQVRGVVTATGLQTQIGRLSDILQREKQMKQPPLVVRMKKFTYQISLCVFIGILAIFFVEIVRQSPWEEIFLLSLALAVSIIPEGLPIALTVALSIATQRMAKRHVIVRKLIAVESLGSCTAIASDKTGTLTVNRLTVKEIAFPNQKSFKVSGEGLNPKGNIEAPWDILASEQMKRFLLTCVLCNDAAFYQEREEYKHKGDMVDVALLVLATKAGVNIQELQSNYPQLAQVPYESECQCALSLNRIGEESRVLAKGALEKLLPFCSKQLVEGEEQSIDEAQMLNQAERLAEKGFRTLAFADKVTTSDEQSALLEENLYGLTLLGLVGMIDPLRAEAKSAVKECQRAGIAVMMITGDHPKTALAIAKQLQFAESMDQVVTGKQLKEELEKNKKKETDLICQSRVFARVEPSQKVDIVNTLKAEGHFVAVTGDGANDAPALATASVGVAMGKRGTDVARESSDILLTDDNFSSIVNGIEEGRIAFRNVRKVIFLLISTSLAEVVLFALALSFDLPLPLIATQLLWLNMITNGIQDVALALEPKEGDEMQERARDPKQPIFNKLMLKRVVLSGLYMGVVAFVLFQTLLHLGFNTISARNSTLLLIVLFENIHVFNSRSESRSIFSQRFFGNPLLIFGTLIAQGIHIGAMYTPWLSQVLAIQPVSFLQWLTLLGVATTLLGVMELEKYIRKRRKERKANLSGKLG